MQAILQSTLDRLAAEAQSVPCECVPYRGETVWSQHFSHCPWERWMDGFVAALDSMEYDVDTLPDLPIVAKRK